MNSIEDFIKQYIKTFFSSITGLEYEVKKCMFDNYARLAYGYGLRYFGIDFFKLKETFPGIKPDEEKEVIEGIADSIKELVESRAVDLLSQWSDIRTTAKREGLTEMAKKLLIIHWMTDYNFDPTVKDYQAKINKDIDRYTERLKNDISKKLGNIVIDLPTLNTFLHKIYSSIMLKYYGEKIIEGIIEILQSKDFKAKVQSLIAKLPDLGDNTFAGLNFEDPKSVRECFLDEQPEVLRKYQAAIGDANSVATKEAAKALQIHIMITLLVYESIKNVRETLKGFKLKSVNSALDFYTKKFSSVADIGTMYTELALLYSGGAKSFSKVVMKKEKEEEFAKEKQVFLNIDKAVEALAGVNISEYLKEKFPKEFERIGVSESGFFLGIDNIIGHTVPESATIDRVKAQFMVWASNALSRAIEEYSREKNPQNLIAIKDNLEKELEELENSYEIIKGIQNKAIDISVPETPSLGKLQLFKERGKNVSSFLDAFEKKLMEILESQARRTQ
jgi:hypothetical protein